MANYVNVPGIKNSTGLKQYKPYLDGEYQLECKAVDIKEPKNKSPADVWNFTWDILSGPPQEDGKSPKGRKFYNRVTIMHPEHPSMTGKEPADQRGVDELKSMILACGVEISKGDKVVPDSFVGTECRAKITQEADKNDPEKIYNNVTAWMGIA